MSAISLEGLGALISATVENGVSRIMCQTLQWVQGSRFPHVHATSNWGACKCESDCTITSKDQARLTVEEAWELGTCLFKRARPKEELAVRGVGGEVRVWE